MEKRTNAGRDMAKRVLDGMRGARPNNKKPFTGNKKPAREPINYSDFSYPQSLFDLINEEISSLKELHKDTDIKIEVKPCGKDDMVKDGIVYGERLSVKVIMTSDTTEKLSSIQVLYVENRVGEKVVEFPNGQKKVNPASVDPRTKCVTILDGEGSILFNTYGISCVTKTRKYLSMILSKNASFTLRENKKVEK